MRTILYTGKGGVGKTSVAAATALVGYVRELLDRAGLIEIPQPAPEGY